jgi:hypothetical protein
MVQNRDAKLSESRERIAWDNNDPSDKAHVLIGLPEPLEEAREDCAEGMSKAIVLKGESSSTPGSGSTRP